jgi:hypothetical protein
LSRNAIIEDESDPLQAQTPTMAQQQHLPILVLILSAIILLTLHPSGTFAEEYNFQKDLTLSSSQKQALDKVRFTFLINHFRLKRGFKILKNILFLSILYS